MLLKFVSELKYTFVLISYDYFGSIVNFILSVVPFKFIFNYYFTKNSMHGVKSFSSIW